MEKLTELKKDRIEIIDILRGFALLGIIIVHFTEQYYAGQPPEAVKDFGAKNIADNIVQGFSFIFIQGKFYMIFSFLFGLSFFIQMDKNNGSPAFLARFAWRLIVLFAIGFLHHLHYRGDILTIYAVLGFSLLLCYKLSGKTLLIIALLLIFNIPSLGVRLYQAVFQINPFPNTDQKQLQLYFDTVKSGSYFDILKANLHVFTEKADYQISSGRLYITLGLFLLGLYSGRKNFFGKWEEQIPWIKKLCKISLWTILGSVIFAVAFFGGTQAAGLKINAATGWAVGGLAYDVFSACLAVLYVMAILLLFRKEKWKPRLMQFYALGRMGLTTYLMQTLFGFFIYFSVGLGLLGDLGALPCMLIGLAVFIFQIFFSKWWLKNFRFGPVEWLWRSLTYFKIQPMSKPKLELVSN
ncbi:MAG TPA: DUF418 domain-containing protein [Cyclobacteriaceae bacterium]|nr:DUF418 domain-containing protein [Cyclobacteriaceae bacterium]